MRKFSVLLISLLLILPGFAAAMEALSLQLYALNHFSVAVPTGWTAESEDGLSIFHAPADSAYSGAFLSAEEVDVSDYAPFETESLYDGYCESMGGQNTGIMLDGHSARLIELTSDTGSLCVVLYCRGVNLLALSATAPDTQADAIRSILLNVARYTAFLG